MFLVRSAKVPAGLMYKNERQYYQGLKNIAITIVFKLIRNKMHN